MGRAGSFAALRSSWALVTALRMSPATDRRTSAPTTGLDISPTTTRTVIVPGSRLSIGRGTPSASAICARATPSRIETAAAHYVEEDPDTVAEALTRETTRLAAVADAAGVDQWDRGLTVGTSRTSVRRMLAHALHDSLHPIDDVTRGLALLRRS